MRRWQGELMKIAYIGSRGFPGIFGGVEKSLQEMAPRLAARGHEVSVYASDKIATDQAVYEGVYLRRLPALSTKHFDTITRSVLSIFDCLFK